MSDFLDQISALSPKRLALLAVKLKESLDCAQAAAREPIAVVGIGCRFPGANDPDAFWALLHEGRHSIREITADRWNIDKYYDPDPDAPGKMSTRSGGFLEQIGDFDPHFFGIAPREALVMDPQQRLLLEVTWEALEHAGLVPSHLAGSRTGVFIGICNTDYHQLLLTRGTQTIDAHHASGSAHSVAAGRLSYVLGLQGPSLAIDTSCSASLVAIHAACQSLRSGESSVALAGGVNIICAPETFIALSKAHMLAPDGRCKTFDASADGFSRGEGCGIVVLKRLSDARQNGDRILAVIRGSAVNQDGRSGGLTVPNGPAQEAVIRDALAAAGLKGTEIGYVEAHGTGTPLGDPIEFRALGRALGEGRDPSDPLLIGSVKTNIGHLEAAAGVAGLIKIVLALQNEEIPPHLNFEVPSPHIDWADFPVEVAKKGRSWLRGNSPRRAGVSSFGFSGTNAHAILEEAPPASAAAASPERPLHCLTLSAVDENSLRRLARRYADVLEPHHNISLADAAFTAGARRSHMDERLAVIAANEVDARAALMRAAVGETDEAIRRGSIVAGRSNEVVFLYTGAGAQYPGMSHALYQTSPVFRDVIDSCDALLGADDRGLTLKSVLFANSEPNGPIHEIGWTQPAMFAVEYGLTELWRSWGVKAAAVIGHSVGEYAAACTAGIFSLEDGLRLIAERGRLMAALPPGGAMAAVFAPADEVFAALEPVLDRVAVAAVNAPANTVIAGEAADVESLLASFARRNVMGQRLFVSLAAHSPLVNPALDAMETLARGVPMSPPRIPLACNLTGRILPADVAPDAHYWRRHMREPVCFAAGVKTLYDAGYRIFLEIGPHPTLLALAQQNLPDEGCRMLTSLRRGKEDWSELLTSLADLHVHGIPVDWAAVDRPYARRVVSLPHHSFDRKRYWAAPEPQIHCGQSIESGALAGVAKHPADGLFYKIKWELARAARPRLPAPSDLAIAAGDRFYEIARENDFAVYDRLTPELDRLTADYIGEALLRLGFDATPGRAFDASGEARRLQIAPRYHRLFARQLAILADHGVLQPQQDGYSVMRPEPTGEADARCAELLIKFPEANAELQIVRRCGASLSRLLRGDQDPLPLLFSGDLLPLVRSVYAETAFARTYNGMLAELVHRVVKSAGKPPRVLEIGAGTGGTTRYILPKLHPDTEYLFTDVSPIFLTEAQDRFRNYPGLRTALLDIAHDPSQQGIESGSYDLVIASNALHATEDMYRTMTNVSRLLAPGGILLLIEGLAPEQWVNISFAFIEGWWKFADFERRPSDPFLSRGGWERLLNDAGYSDVVILPDDRAVGSAARQAVIMAAWPSDAQHQWIVLADSGDLGQHLEAELGAVGDTVNVVPPALWRPALRLAETLLQQDWWLTATKPSASAGAVDIVYLGALDAGETEKSAPNLYSHAALTLLQGAATLPSARVWLVTRGAQDVGGSEDVVAPDQAALWGLGRTFALEHPAQWGGLIDLDPQGDESAASAAVREAVRSKDGEDQMAWRGGVRRVPRLVADAAPPARPIVLRSDASYLVTGGLGGLGVAVAEWLASRGARHLVLISRTPLRREPTSVASAADERIASVVKLERTGAKVDLAALDVGDPVAMAEVMARFGREWPPLAGIVHAAVAPTAAPLIEVSRDMFDAMFRAKVGGARLLDELSKSQPVDFIVNFSTTTALLGAPHLAHYAAANAVLDAMACHQPSNGRRALSVNWGSWDRLRGVDEKDHARIVRGGLRPMPTAVGIAALESLLASGATRAVVADIDWPVLRAAYESRRPQPLLSRVATAPESGVGASSAVVAEDAGVDFAMLAANERRDAIEQAVRREVSAVIGLHEPGQLNAQESLFAMGLDSLMAIELKRRLERVVSAELPSAVAFNYPTIKALADLLDSMVVEQIEEESKDTSTLLKRLPEMSGAEVDALLNKILAEEGTP
jgi:acyl transferase domain-containing protein/SAM-dependent methyltransferase/aryl carrier-like protein